MIHPYHRAPAPENERHYMVIPIPNLHSLLPLPTSSLTLTLTLLTLPLLLIALLLSFCFLAFPSRSFLVACVVWGSAHYSRVLVTPERGL